MKNLFLSFVFFGLILPIVGLSQVIDSEFNPVFSREVSARKIENAPDDKLVIFGTFTSVDDYPTRSLVRLFPDGGLDTTFFFDERIIGKPELFAVQANSKIILGGEFTNLNGDFLGHLIRLDASGHLDSTFTPLTDTSLTITGIEILPNQKIFVAFNKCSIQSSNNCFFSEVRLLDKDGMPDRYFPDINFTPNENFSSFYLGDIDFQSNNALIVMGKQLQLDSLVQTAFRFDSLGVLDTTFNPVILSDRITRGIRCDITPNGSIGIISAERSSFTVLDSMGNSTFNRSQFEGLLHVLPLGDDNFLIVDRDETWVFRTGNLTRTILVGLVEDVTKHQDGIIIAGRAFNKLLRYDMSGSDLLVDTNFKNLLKEPAPVGPINRNEDGKILASNGFDFINGQRVGPMARLNPDGSLDTTFSTLGISRNPNYEPFNFEVLPNGKIVVGSRRDGDGRAGRLNGLNLWNEDGAFFSQFDITPNPLFTSTAIDNLAIDSEGRIYILEITGSIDDKVFLQLEETEPFVYEMNVLNQVLLDSFVFSTLRGIQTTENDQLLVYGEGRENGVSLPNLFKMNADRTLDLSFNADLPDGLRTSDVLTTKDDLTFVSGRRVLSTGEIINVLYKLDPDGKRDISFSPSFEFENRFVRRVIPLAELPNGWILVTGTFNKYNDISIPSNKMIIDKNGQLIQEFLPDVEGYINDLGIIDEESVYISGRFETPDGTKAILKIIEIPQLTTNTKVLVNEPMVELFPNPVRGQKLNLKLPSEYLHQTFDYSILETASGRLVQNGQIEVRAQNQIALPSHLQGAYMIQLKNGATNLVQRFIVQDR